MKKLTILFILFHCIISSHSQNNSFIQIISESEISVYLNERYIGETNNYLGGLLIENINPGLYTIKLYKEGFQTQIESISLKEDEIYSFEAKEFIIEKAQNQEISNNNSSGLGSIFIIGEPGTRVFVDNKLMGFTKEEVGGAFINNVSATTHKIVLKKAGKQDEIYNIIVKRNETTEVYSGNFSIEPEFVRTDGYYIAQVGETLRTKMLTWYNSRLFGYGRKMNAYYLLVFRENSPDKCNVYSDNYKEVVFIAEMYYANPKKKEKTNLDYFSNLFDLNKLDLFKPMKTEKLGCYKIWLSENKNMYNLSIDGEDEHIEVDIDAEGQSFLSGFSAEVTSSVWTTDRKWESSTETVVFQFIKQEFIE